MVEHKEDGILSGEEGRDFWLAWNKTTLLVGKGDTRDSNIILKYIDDTALYNINAVALSTGHGHAGHWEVPFGQGMC